MAVLAAILGSIIGISLIHTDESSLYFNILLKLLLMLALAFPLFTGIALFGERRAWTLKQNIAAIAVAAAFLTGYYFWLPDTVFRSEELFIIRYIMWVIGFILFVTFAPFLKKNGAEAVNGFWHYNRALFFSLALTFVWAAALQAGISIALASIDFLFQLEIDSERYMELWVIVAGIFSTTFFLSRVPKDVESFQTREDYPKELRLFSQYVLVPLVTVYFLILYAYVVRILVLWEWPNGTLAYMILGFSFLGVLAYVSLYPLRNTVPWIKRAGNIFYFILIPQIGMLFWALWFRISQYGFTPKRYFVFVFGWWLLAAAIYFLAGKKKDIRLVPVTIFIIALLSSFGLWGAFAVSEKSQINRLKNILIKNNILVNEKVVKLAGEISAEDQREISATLQYLNEMHGMKGIQPWFGQDLSALEDEIDSPEIKDRPVGRSYSYYDRPQKVAEDLMGISYIDHWEAIDPEGKDFNFYNDYREEEKPLDISRYDYMFELKNIPDDIIANVLIGGDNYRFALNEQRDQFMVLKGEETIANVDLESFLREITKKGRQADLSRDIMKLEFENGYVLLALYLNHISGERKDGENYQVQFINGKVFFSTKL